VPNTPLATPIYGVLLSLVVVAASANPCPPSYASKSATTALERVLEFTNFSAGMFRIRASRHVSNAVAEICNGERYIVVNEDFLEGLGYDTLRWTWPKLYVLAHEIGHHAAGHLEQLGDRGRRHGHPHKDELEADRYAGGLLAKMGATLDQALAAPKSFPKSSSNSHPSRKDRIAATRVGYNEATKKIRFVSIGDTMPDMQRHWSRGLRIDAIGFGPTTPRETARIHVALSRDHAGQSYSVSESVPEDWIEEKWAAGYLIKSLAHSSGGWLAIMESRSGHSYQALGQHWFTSDEFPEEDIETKWGENHLITSLSRGRSRWAIVTTEATRRGSQRWFKNYAPQKMRDEIRNHWDRGYHVTSLGWNSDSRFTFVMTHLDGRSKEDFSEACYWRPYFPEEIISDYLRRGYRVAHLVHGFDRWVVVMTTRPPGLD